MVGELAAFTYLFLERWKAVCIDSSKKDGAEKEVMNTLSL